MHQITLKEIELNDLPHWSEWPHRMLSQAPWTIPERTVEKVEVEYNQDKYSKLLTLVNSEKKLSWEELKLAEMDGGNESIMVSLHERFFITTVRDAVEYAQDLMLQAMESSIAEADIVVELGCSYGYNIFRLHSKFPNKRFLGGEFCKNAVDAGNILSARAGANVEVFEFNYYSCPYQRVQELVAGSRVLIFTAHSIEQVPKTRMVVESISQLQCSALTVFHFEPTFELYGPSLIGLMRKRYCELNDYSRDLLSSLKATPTVCLDSVEDNVWGFNPFNPTSILKWHT